MKKTIALLILSTLLLGCTQNNNPTITPVENNTTTLHCDIPTTSCELGDVCTFKYATMQYTSQVVYKAEFENKTGEPIGWKYLFKGYEAMPGWIEEKKISHKCSEERWKEINQLNNQE